jgi:type VI secretion system secreted protein Hcp
VSAQHQQGRAVVGVPEPNGAVAAPRDQQAAIGAEADALDAADKNWIELYSFQLGVGRSISSPVGGVNDREATAPSVSEIMVSKVTDCSTLKLLGEALEGEGKTVQIDFCRTNQGKLDVYLSYTLTNCMISGHSFASNGDDRPHENVSLSFTRIEYKNVAGGSANADGSPETVTYDLALASVV